jgi:hypothetical protein
MNNVKYYFALGCMSLLGLSCHFRIIDNVVPPRDIEFRNKVFNQCALMPVELKTSSHELLEKIARDQEILFNILDRDIDDLTKKRAIETGKRIHQNLMTIKTSNDPKWSSPDFDISQHWEVTPAVYVPILEQLSVAQDLGHDTLSWFIADAMVEAAYYYGIEAPQLAKRVSTSKFPTQVVFDLNLKGSWLDMCHFRSSLVVFVKVVFKTKEVSNYSSTQYFKLLVKNWL